LLETLPDGWEERLQPDSDVPYYVELATGKTSIEHPADDYYRNVLADARTSSRADASDSHLGEMNFFDPESEQHYTHNFKTGESYQGSVADQPPSSPANSAANAVPVAVPSFARLPDAAVGRTPVVAGSESMMGLTPTKLLESHQSGGSKQLFPSSPAGASIDLMAQGNISETTQHFDQLEQSGSTASGGGAEIVQIQAHNRALNHSSQLQVEARKESNSAARSAARQRAKSQLKSAGVYVIKFAARNHKPASKILMLSQDNKYLQWGDSPDKLTTRVELKTVARLEYGDIQVSQRAASKHALISSAFNEPWQTFFLWDGKRSYDFYVPDDSGGTAATVIAMVAINAARGVSGRSTRIGHFLWKAARMRLRMMAWEANGDDSLPGLRKVLAGVLKEMAQMSTVQRSMRER
jgi:hypothetical protein